MSKKLLAGHHELNPGCHSVKKTPELMQEFSAIYPSSADFVNSTAATRANGYVGGYGSAAALELELESLGLSANGRERLCRIVQRVKR